MKFLASCHRRCCSNVAGYLYHQRSPIPLLPYRLYSSVGSQGTGDINVQHSNFLSQASSATKWREGRLGNLNLNGHDNTSDDFENVSKGEGKLSPTSSHLFRLILPLEPSSSTNPNQCNTIKSQPEPVPTVFLLHPSQPLSHVSLLILASLAPASPTISFRSASPGPMGKAFQWSHSMDVGDFIKDAARAAKFSIHINYDSPRSRSSSFHYADEKTEKEDKQESASANEQIIYVEVPTFADRTRFLRRRLAVIQKRLGEMEGLKLECDREARRGAKQMAMGGFGMLVVYWGAVARLTFWDYGWDVMEPITYLSGLSTVICGYLWFLYQGREVSYTSILDRSISARREALYKVRGLDIELWVDLVADQRSLKGEIKRIAEDYDDRDRVRNGEEGQNEATNAERETGRAGF